MRLLLAAGGTGGHVFPAIAVAQAAKAFKSDIEILFVGTPKGLETELVPKAGYTLKLIQIDGLKGKALFERARTVLFLPQACLKAWKILQNFSPNAVFGIGGYASGPLLLVAVIKGFKTAILEPNVIPGFSNRLLGRFVNRIFLAFEESQRWFPKSKCIVSGNPIREDIVNVLPPTFEGHRKTILIFGGSQGAHRINEAVIEMLHEFVNDRDRLFFIHQTGVKDEERVRKAYESAGLTFNVQAFFNNMAEVYKKSDLVIARAGSSVLEIAACGRPAILIPFPSAADDHQRENAKVIEKNGAAIVVEDAHCNGPTLASILKSLLDDRRKLRQMSGAALKLRHDHAAAKIVADLLPSIKERQS